MTTEQHPLEHDLIQFAQGALADLDFERIATHLEHCVPCAEFLRGLQLAFKPGEAVTTHKPITEGPGSIIGPYKLLQQLGEGGMGVVYMAEQEKPVRRIVALKIIKPGMDSRQVIARFEAERQALAMMDHNNVARVLGERIGNVYPNAFAPTLAFSPDGKWLVASTSDEYRFWRVPEQVNANNIDSWRQSHSVSRAAEGSSARGGGMSFTPDGTLMAITHSLRNIWLIDPHSGQHYATLEAPRQHQLMGLCFSGDGSRLAAACYTAHQIQVWDLRLIRQQLREMSLDWDPAPTPSNGVDEKPSSPLKVVIDRGV